MRIKKRRFSVSDVIFNEVTAPKMRGYMNWLAGCNGYTDIYDAYKYPSINKVRSWRIWCNVCAILGGENMKIVSANCQSYTITFDFVNPIDGDLCTAYITKDYTRFCSK